MKKRVLALLLSAVLLTGLYGCSNASVSQETGQAGTETAEESSATDGADARQEVSAEEGDEARTSADASVEADYTTGSPWIDSNIESNVESAGEVSLKDNFDLAQNGQWVKENEIKSGEYSNTYITSFTDTLHERLLDIMKQEPDDANHDAMLVSTYYQQLTDWEVRDAAGGEVLLPYLQEIEDLQKGEDLERYITGTDYKFSNPLGWGTMVDPGDATRNILVVGAPGYFLQDTADYDDLENMSDSIRRYYDYYKKRVETVLSKCGYTREQADEIYQGAIEFEKRMTAYCYTNDENVLTEVHDKVYGQVYTPEELEKYQWFSLLKKAVASYGIEEIPAVCLGEKMDYFDHLDELLGEDNLEIIKDYLLAHTASSAICLLDKDTYYAGLDLQNEMMGITGYKQESEYAVEDVASDLSWPLSVLYCRQYVTEQDKQTIKELIEEIIDGYKEMLQKEDFLSDATKEKAIQKLDTMIINCMYPDDWSEYSHDALQLSDNYFDSYIEIKQYETRKGLSEFYDPVEKDVWSAVPIEQNAFYDFSNNSINILPGLIGDILYNDDMSKEEIYGKAGVVIGHEISHAFDAMGANYDADGNYKDWWTEEDKENYKEKTDKLVEYYNNITIWDGLTCNGELVKTEACADMGGVAVLLHLAAEDPDFDYEKFFTSYAKSWASNSTTDMAEYATTYDEHPVSYLRVNVTVAQFEEFYETFDVKEGDGMYIAPEDRVRIW